MRGDYEDNRGNDDAKNPEEDIDAAVKGSVVWIDFGRHEVCDGYLLSVI